jgi:phage-related protein
MIYFTISNLFPAQENRVIYLDNNTQISFAPRKRVVKFGEGYELSIPKSPTLKNFSGSFSNRTPEEINVIDTYLSLLNGEVIPNFSILGSIVPVACVNYSKSYQNGQIFSLQGQFKEELR